MMAASAAAGLILFVTTPASSQETITVMIDSVPVRVGLMADTEDAVRWKVLAEREGIDSKKSLRETARENLLNANRLPYEFQRVEVAGMLDTDDTSEKLPDMFDRQLKLSNRDENFLTRSPLVNRLKSYLSGFIDLREAMSDTQGYPTERAAKIIAELKGARINELFAHSWGTEAVYLGLLNGKIIPPKKLFIVGVPEANEEKWLMLAKYTGIEIHVVGFEWDKAKIAGDLVTKLKSGLPADTAGLEKLWGKSCAARSRSEPACADPDKFIRTKFDYDIHVRPPDVPKDKFIKGRLTSLDHDRMLYYTYLQNRKLLYKTVAQLEAPQLKLVKVEENRILARAMDEARSLIAQAKEQERIQNRDHDERLKNLYVGMSLRSCANPGSVTQAELDRLPKPYGTDVMSAMPRGLGECGGMVYSMLSYGATAEEIRVMSLPSVVSVDALVPPPPQAVQPVRRAPAAPVDARTPFSSTLPGLKALSVTACRSRGQVPVDKNLIQPPLPYSSWGEMDEEAAGNLSAGLGNCENRLFRRLIELIRAGQGDRVTAQWVQETAAAYRDASDAAPGYTRPQTGGGDPCRDHGNIRCP